MKIILKPLFRTRLGEIALGDGDFLVGRFEEPFASCNEPFVARLSRRHALILAEKGMVYLIDLGSLNGTKLNDQPVRGNVATLRAGDKISFAGQAAFQVVIKDKAKSAPLSPTSAIQLVLTPASNAAGFDSITATDFPFLVSAVDERLIGCADQPPATEQKVHPLALLMLKDGQIFVTDVSQPFITMVNGYLLEGETAPLQEHAQLAFGGDRFVYSVRIIRQGAGNPSIDLQATTAIDTYESAAPPAAQTQPTKTFNATKTTYVETATPFLDIFCHRETADGLATETAEAYVPPGNSQALVRGGLISKLRAWGVQLKNLVTGKAAVERRKLGWIAGIGIFLIGFGAFLYLREATERQLTQLLAKGQFTEATQLASDYLRTHSDNETVSALGTEALVKYVVPYWMKNLERKEYTEAEATLDNARSRAQFNDAGLKALKLLKWVSEMEQFAAEREGTSPVIFHDEIRMQDLLKRWDEDASGHERLLGMIARYETAFESVRFRSFSRLRSLRNDASIYLKAIEGLKAAIVQKLQADRPEELAPVFKDFSAKYPSVGGMDALNQDLGHYLELGEVIRTKTLALVPQFLKGDLFVTPPFRDKAAKVTQEALPSREILAEYQEATARWREGDKAGAMAVLDLLTRKTWGEVAARTLERYKKISIDFKIMQETSKVASPGDCNQQLFDFRSTLSRAEDTFFLEATEADFQRCRVKALEDAEESFRLAKSSWDAYRENGGISGQMRLELSLSERFRQQAKRLADACSHAARGMRIYDQLSLPYAAQWRELGEQALREIKQQRQSLDDLNIVIDPALLKRKLDLLPIPQRDNS